MDNGFRICRGVETVPASLKFRAKIAVIVDLAVEGYPDSLVLIRKRLVASGQVDDAEAAIAEAELPVKMKTFIVRAAVDHCIGATFDTGAVHRSERSEIVDSTNATHGMFNANCRYTGP